MLSLKSSLLRINAARPTFPLIPLLLAIGVLSAGQASARGEQFITFESGQTRPLALSPDGRTLYAVNTPDGRLEVFDVDAGTPTPVGSVSVGMEPVAVATHGDDRVWVVNHLSDSVSVVDVSDRTGPEVVRTLQVGDEPQDVVFAGPGGDRAFVTAAHRGAHSPYPRGEFREPGVGRADVWVFDANDPGPGAAGAPIAVLTLFGDKPRALAVSPDGSTVHAAIFRSGNRTTVVGSDIPCRDSLGPCLFASVPVPGSVPPPLANVEGVTARAVGLVVKYEGELGEWRDELGRSWNEWVKLDLPDLDVFTIDADATVPVVTGAVSGVGTTLFNMAVNPVTGRLYVSNTESRNEVRFEGPGVLAGAVKPAGEPATVRGHIAESRITVIDETGVKPRHLNAHIPYEAIPMPAGVEEASLATPLGMAVSDDGETLYVAAFGSSEIAVLSTNDLEAGRVSPADRTVIEVDGGGPSGLVLGGDLLYVMTRFDNAIAVIDVEAGRHVDRVELYNPEPPSVVEGRPFLYDARATSSNGEASCAACHIFGDTDDLAWDLGNPDATIDPNPNPIVPLQQNALFAFHPMKGPMTTQTLRGLANHGAMHWRGDRAVGDLTSPESEEVAFAAFNVAFEGLLGRDEGPLDEADMQAFTDFALQIVAPPNPNRLLDNQLRADEARGRDTFMNDPNVILGGGRCNDCHTLSPEDGHFGTSGLTQNQAEVAMKVAPLRSAYQKVGMFGVPFTFLGSPYRPEHLGPQVRGFGFSHNGAIDTIFNILDAAFFLTTPDESRDLEAFVIAFPGDLPPIVGQQVTLRSDNAELAGSRIDLMIERAKAPWTVRGRPFTHECDLVVKGVIGGAERGYLMDPDGRFRPDQTGLPVLGDAEIRSFALLSGTPITYTCVPSGSGVRVALDRDEDGILNGDEQSSPPGLPNPQNPDGPQGSPGGLPDFDPGDDSDDAPEADADIQQIIDWLTATQASS